MNRRQYQSEVDVKQKFTSALNLIRKNSLVNSGQDGNRLSNIYGAFAKLADTYTRQSITQMEDLIEFVESDVLKANKDSD